MRKIPKSKIPWYLKALYWLWALIAMFVFGIITLVALLPFGWGGYSFKEFARISSSDGLRSVLVEKKLTFPALDIIDPAIKVRIRLIEDEKIITDEKELVFFENSDLKAPIIDWKENGANVINLSNREELVVELQNKSSEAMVEATPPL